MQLDRTALTGEGVRTMPETGNEDEPVDATLCYSCPHGQARRVAVYMWTCALSGNTVPLCVECCAWWRMNARLEPDLAPSRIRQIRAA